MVPQEGASPAAAIPNPVLELRKKNAELTGELKKASEKVEKLEGQVKKLKETLTGKVTQIKNLKKKPMGKKAPLIEHG